MKLNRILLAIAIIAMTSAPACAQKAIDNPPAPAVDAKANPAKAAEQERADSQQYTVIDIPSKNVVSPLKCTVIMPKHYDAFPEKRFPVVYLLNGYDGDHRQWPSTGRYLHRYATAYEMILVCPDGRDSWYWDSPIDPKMKMESFITEELVPYIDSNYRTIADRRHRAISGLSMGGHGAMYLSMRHPDIFGSAGSMSGGLNAPQKKWANSWKMKLRLGPYATNAARWREHSAIAQIARIKPGDLNLIIDCGADDFFAGINDEFHQALVAAKIPHDYIVRPGRHSHDYWRNSIRYHLLFFHTVFEAEE